MRVQRRTLVFAALLLAGIAGFLWFSRPGGFRDGFTATAAVRAISAGGGSGSDDHSTTDARAIVKDCAGNSLTELMNRWGDASC